MLTKIEIHSGPDMQGRYQHTRHYRAERATCRVCGSCRTRQCGCSDTDKYQRSAQVFFSKIPFYGIDVEVDDLRGK